MSLERGRALPAVSFIVPVRNERMSIRDCILALVAQGNASTSVEIVVAEGGSTDGTRALLHELAAAMPELKIVDNPSGRTPDALNAAIRASSGIYICRVDGHSRIQPDHVARCLEAIRRTGAWCVGGGMVQSSTTPFGRAAAAASSSRFGVGDSSFHYAATAGPVESVFLGFWPRWVFERIGMFDPELLRNQDDELSYRIRAAGGIVWFDPGIQTTYQPRESWRRLFDQYRQYGKFKVRVFQKHTGAARLRHFVPAIFVASVASAVVVPIVPWLLPLPFASFAAYGIVNLTVSGRVARHSQTAMLDVGRAFLAMHAGYGIGFWQGVVAYGTKWNRGRAPVPRLLADE